MQMRVSRGHVITKRTFGMEITLMFFAKNVTVMKKTSWPGDGL